MTNLRKLAELDPALAAELEKPEFRAALAAQDARIVAAAERPRDPVEQPARVQLPAETQAMLRGIARAVSKEIEHVKRELRAEIDVLREHTRRAMEMAQQPRRRKKKKWTRKDIERFIDSKPEVTPDE
jgi:hypothetical protein